MIIELLHDVHERIEPIAAVNLCKELERYHPFFIEDPLAPEANEYFKMIRQQTSTPIAMGELFNNPHEWVGLISNRLIDFIRVHISQVGGLTAARKIAALAEWFQVRTRLAWTRRCFARGARCECAPGPGDSQFWHPGGRSVQPGDTGCFSGSADHEERLHVR